MGAEARCREMDAHLAKDPKLLSHYEGLVRKTASMTHEKLTRDTSSNTIVEQEFEDICQFYRYKVWKALESFDPRGLRKKPRTKAELNLARDRYVFSCIKNAEKDVLKKKRHGHLFIESVAPIQGNGVERKGHTMTRSSFEERYLLDENAFAGVEDEMPVVPSTLTTSEEAVLLLLYIGFDAGEVAEEKELPRVEVNAIVRSIRQKMADWKPGSDERRLVAIEDVIAAERLGLDPVPAPA